MLEGPVVIIILYELGTVDPGSEIENTETQSLQNINWSKWTIFIPLAANDRNCHCQQLTFKFYVAEYTWSDNGPINECFISTRKKLRNIFVVFMEFTTLPRQIREISLGLEHSGKCGRVTDHVAIKCGRACRSLPNQSAFKDNRNKFSPRNTFVLATLDGTWPILGAQFILEDSVISYLDFYEDY
ncbi:hypothetical protein ACTXT7_012935 [Hymenolepis weldensis]